MLTKEQIKRFRTTPQYVTVKSIIELCDDHTALSAQVAMYQTDLDQLRDLSEQAIAELREAVKSLIDYEGDRHRSDWPNELQDVVVGVEAYFAVKYRAEHSNQADRLNVLLPGAREAVEAALESITPMDALNTVDEVAQELDRKEWQRMTDVLRHGG